ncbi:unnamed protein product, partial [Medioppia subpectinata]
TGEVIPMPVPSSFNDITQNRFIRDYAGWVWYDRDFFVPSRWQHRSLTLRFGSAHYESIVYVNGVEVVRHIGGHLPFQAYVTKHVKYGANNRITVALNNILSDTTIPQGGVRYKTDLTKYPKGFYETTTNFDFFNYAGIHRHVSLYALPVDHIDDIAVTTDIKDTTTGVIHYEISHSEKISAAECVVEVMDKSGKKVAEAKGYLGSITIPNAKLWWPYTTDPNPGYLYTLRVSLVASGKTSDVYYERVGIRTVKATDKQLLINGKAVYLTGFGKHEDANIRGKGLDLPILAKDFNLIKWIGANSFRTSHYPYSEELMDMADEVGIMVVDECPAVGLGGWKAELLAQHKQTITEMIARDKNHASVVMWSVANEPGTDKVKSPPYWVEIHKHIKALDTSRPITAAIAGGYREDLVSAILDVLMINRYWGWYQDTGYPQAIEKQLVNDLSKWWDTHKKPIMVSEYGSDTVAGLHTDPPFVWSEDYQSEIFGQFFKAFDTLKAKGFFAGEHVWNFADFMTGE